MSLKEKFKEFLGQIDLSTVTVCPIFLSNDVERHDCDQCKGSEQHLGDLYDESVCLDCWRAIDDFCEK